MNTELHPRPMTVIRQYRMVWRDTPVTVTITDDRPSLDPDAPYHPGELQITPFDSKLDGEVEAMREWLLKNFTFHNPDHIPMVRAEDWRRS
jgi:hypothetical protein